MTLCYIVFDNLFSAFSVTGYILTVVLSRNIIWDQNIESLYYEHPFLLRINKKPLCSS